MESSGETLMAYHQWQLLRGTDIKAFGRQRGKKRKSKRNYALESRVIFPHFCSF